jgi:hypothetical protein
MIWKIKIIWSCVGVVVMVAGLILGMPLVTIIGIGMVVANNLYKRDTIF